MKIQTYNKLIQARTKSTFVLLGILSISYLSSASAATIKISVEANIVPTINVQAQNGIVFGEISTSSIPGTVSIETSGARTTTGGTSVNTNTSGSPAQFEISGEPNANYTITLPYTVEITSGTGDTMTVGNFSSNPPTSGQLQEDGTININIGGSLSVRGFQPMGLYSGVISATVEYN